MRPKIEITAPQEISSIVVALDETPKAEKALIEAIELARRYDAKLKVISVMEYFRIIEQSIDLASYGIEKQVKKIDLKLAEEEGLEFSHEQALGPKPSELARFLVITEPAPTIISSPIFKFGRMVAFEPI